MVNESNRNADIVIVSSYANGFGTKNSDLDLAIINPPRYRFLAIEILKKLVFP